MAFPTRRRAVARSLEYLVSPLLSEPSMTGHPVVQLSSLRNFTHQAPAERFCGSLADSFNLARWLGGRIGSSTSQSFVQLGTVSRLRHATRGPGRHLQAYSYSSRPLGRDHTIRNLSERPAPQSKSSQQGLYLVALVVGMVGLTYASVPLYRMFCQATGYGGTVQQGSTVEEKLRRRKESADLSLEAVAASRDVTVSFNADVTDGMNWHFVPTQRSVRISPGQSTLAFYTAHNLSDKAVTGVSTYNVSPQQAGAYFNKIQCFCFEEQKLRPGEKVDMPVFFYIDPEFATDPRMKGIDHLTLSYTFFKVEEEEAVVEAGEQAPQPAGLVAHSG